MATVIHTMADGTVRDSIEGMVIPCEEFYIVLAEIQKRYNETLLKTGEEKR